MRLNSSCCNKAGTAGCGKHGFGYAIIGNMNVGKTTLFSRMCKTRAMGVNIPGTSVTVASGRIAGMGNPLYDTPGICSIFSHNEDERASRDIFLLEETAAGMGGIILVADAKNMKRSLAIALQYAEYGLPMLLVVNMIDEGESRGIEINNERLSAVLGIDVCSSIARDGIGVGEIVSRLGSMRVPKKIMKYPPKVERFLAEVEQELKSPAISPRIIGLLLLAGDRGLADYLERNFDNEVIARLNRLAGQFHLEDSAIWELQAGNLYNKKAAQVLEDAQTVEPSENYLFLTRFGDWCTDLKTGIPIAIGILAAVYMFLGTFGATYLVDTINGTFFEGLLIPWVTKLVEPIPSAFIRDLIIDPDFGVLPTGVFLALGLVLPVLFCFYLVFGVLEESGYLPRLSILLDKIFQKMGLNGKGVIPLIMGFSCVTMAILTTRMLDTDKEKNIATFLLLLGMPCAPLLAVMFIILDPMPISATIMVFGLIFVQILLAGFLANKIIPGSRTPLLMEIPAMRVPGFQRIIKMSTLKTYHFMKEAVPIFILASLIVFFIDRLGGLRVLEQVSRPVIDGFMGLPEKSVQVFIKTIIRRESGATEIAHLSGVYTNLQIIVNLLVMTFLSPCINAAIVVFKERGLKVGIAIMGTVFIYAITVGSLINHCCRMLNITFS